MLASEIEKGKIVCWFQGRSEFGPRALGSRSFISDPRRKEMKDILNSRVKFREWFRPFAPVILEEHVNEYFACGRSPYMSFVYRGRKGNNVPAVIHKDGTARVQTMEYNNPSITRLILEKWYEETGCPLLLNTSLNIRGEPMVDTINDAIRFVQEKCNGDYHELNTSRRSSIKIIDFINNKFQMSENKFKTIHANRNVTTVRAYTFF